METLDGYLSHIRRPLSSLFQREDDDSSVNEGQGVSKVKVKVKGKGQARQSNRSEADADSESEDDSDSEDEMDLIGKFSFAPFFSSSSSGNPSRGFMSLEHYHWLIQRYLAPYGEPSGIIAAKDPEVPPPIDHIEFEDKPEEPASASASASVSASEPTSTVRSILSNVLSKKQSQSSSLTDDDEEEQQRRLERRKRRRRRLLRQRRLSSIQKSTTTNAIPLEGPPPVLLTEKQLRQKILEIKELNLSDRERDRMVQKLMTKNYYRIKGLDIVEGEESDTVNNANIQEDIEEHSEADSDEAELGDSDEENSQCETDSEDFSLSLTTSQDKKPTYVDPSSDILGCEHYQRGCKLQCSTCDKWYTCRICHDASESHKLIRQKTRNMLCMHCKTPQPAGQECSNCHEILAGYYCDICKLWDDDSHKSIFHCPDCGICRIGQGLGKDFFHCKTCNVCMSIELENAHRCIEHSTECDCPICGEFMFTSTETVVFMKCGHSIHQSCYRQHTKSSYKCPTCQRSVINMEASFRVLDTEIASQMLPEPYSNWRSIIVCNDCSAKSNVPFHFLGLKCATCRSYNTSQLKLIKPEELEVAESIRPLITSAVDFSDVTIDSEESETEAIVG